MKVKELMQILSQVDPELEVATHANNHTCHHPDQLRVALLQTWQGPCVVIGNMSRRQLNGSAESIVREVDGGKPLPENWAH